MHATAAARATFVDHSLDTASPSRLLVLLYDRLYLDLARGEQAMRAGDRPLAHGQLVHAQEIVGALMDSLDGSWTGAEQLSSIYQYLLTELMGANVAGDADRVAACRDIVEPLRETWREAAATAASEAPRAFVGQTA